MADTTKEQNLVLFHLSAFTLNNQHVVSGYCIGQHELVHPPDAHNEIYMKKPSQSQEPGSPPRSSPWVTGTLPLRVHISRKLESGWRTRTRPRNCDIECEYFNGQFNG